MRRNYIIEREPAEEICTSTLPRLLTLRKAAERLGLSLWAMRERIWSGQIPVVRFPKGRKFYIDVNDLEEFIEKNKDTLS